MVQKAARKVTKFAFTKQRLDAIEPPASDRRWVYDSKVTGLALVVTAAGTRTFYSYRWGDGRYVKVRLGVYAAADGSASMTIEQARTAASHVNDDVQQGIDPNAAKRAKRSGGATVQSLFDLWLIHAKQHKKTWQHDQEKFTYHFGPLKNKRLVDVDTATVAKWHAAIGTKRGTYIANRARALLSAMYGKAHELGYDGPNPCAHVKRFREQSRERFLLPDEMRPFFAALKAEPSPWCEFWLLALFTGARRGNIASMAWNNIDLGQGVWYLPGANAKAGLPLAIVLPPPAVQILKVRHDERNGSGYVFPAVSEAGHVRDPRKSWARVCKAAGLTNLRPHDLRRSLGSWQAIAGSSLQIIGASLGHSDVKSTAVYARLLMDPVRTSVSGAVKAMLEAGEPKKGTDDGQA